MAQAVRGLKRGRAGVPSGMRAEDLKGWLQDASREKNLVKHQWRLLVRLAQRTFKDGVVPEEVAWAMVVFLLKGKGGHWGV